MNELFGNACIIDGEHALSPDSIEKIEARLDRSFCTEGGASQCIMFRSGNDVGSSVLLAYLIKRKINFFVQGNYNQVSSQSDIPSFCDRVLTLARGYEPDSLENAIVLEVNRDCVRCDLLNPLSGYVIFASSGTTGSRKYICFSSTKLLLNASKIVDRFGLSGLSKVLIPVPISHSYGFKVGLLPSMIAGATLRVIDRNNIVKLIGAINDFQPDIVLLTPTLCKMMQVMDVKNKKKALFISAGDKLNEQLYRSFELKFGTLLNLYGCTELGAMAISSEDERDDDRMTGAIKPLKGVNIQLDHSNEELLCSRDDAFDFYLNSLGQLITRRNLWHRTGDRGKYLDNGNLLVSGRIDNCVNRLGFLVSTEEIETELEKLLPQLGQVIVVKDGNKETLTGTSVLAFVENTKDTPVDENTVKKKCITALPRHLVPDEIFFVHHFPRLSSGKVDRAALAQNLRP